MKKTLLIAAAALAAGVISTQAQVYSQNVVGYVNTSIPAQHYQLIGADMNTGFDVNQTNGDVNAVFANGSLISTPSTSPQTTTNTELVFWNGGGFGTFYYYNELDASAMEGDSPGTDPSGWYDKNGNFQTNTLFLGQNHSAFIYNPWAGGAITVTTVGTVQQGTNVSTLNAGYNLICIQEPLGVTSSNLVVDANGNQVSYGLPIGMKSNPTSSPSLTSNDNLVYWNGGGFGTYYYYNQADAETMEGDSPGQDYAGFYDKNGNPFAGVVTTVPVNQGFFIYHNGTPITWTNIFTVQ